MKRAHAPGVAAIGLGLTFACLASCSGWLARSEGIDPTTLPESLRPDYTVFAQRCSKCHSLARPLSSGIDDDDYWAMYVARMRRQPASGISPEDTTLILHFLHYYSEQQREKKAKHEPASPQVPAPMPSTAPPQPSPAPAPSPPPAPPSAPAPTPALAPATSPSGNDGGG
jgi:hypothetical protein